MQFFDLNRQFNLNEILHPFQTLKDLSQQEWFLSKVKVEYDCIEDNDLLEGQAVLKSNHNIQIELEWLIQDTGNELQVLFKGIETVANTETIVSVKGAHIVDTDNKTISSQALSLWIDGTLLPMLPNIKREIKSRLNLWDYAEQQY